MADAKHRQEKDLGQAAGMGKWTIRGLFGPARTPYFGGAGLPY
jgi:hypothetical protein